MRGLWLIGLVVLLTAAASVVSFLSQGRTPAAVLCQGGAAKEQELREENERIRAELARLQRQAEGATLAAAVPAAGARAGSRAEAALGLVIQLKGLLSGPGAAQYQSALGQLEAQARADVAAAQSESTAAGAETPVSEGVAQARADAAAAQRESTAAAGTGGPTTVRETGAGPPEGAGVEAPVSEGVALDSPFGLESAKILPHLKTDLRGVYFLKTPKSAGTSFKKDLWWSYFNFVSPGTVWVIEEGCYGWHTDGKDTIPTDSVMTMVRNPRDHVLSQYFHCKREKHPELPDTFQQWVRNWTVMRASGEALGLMKPDIRRHQWVNQAKAGVPFKCYVPIDMQCRHLTCNVLFNVSQQSDVDGAVRNMESAWFVGITEAYHESFCLFLAKVYVSQPLPHSCNCRNVSAWGSMHMTHDAHGTVKHTVKDYTDDFFLEVDALIAGDIALYKAARARFLREVEEVERLRGVQILCDDTRKRVFE
ncbi:unnamed protein product [Prorocentrum cordatum]|uniref:Sulfotransferase domain-containing protein n=1 Tax=Prorocentrum cordatum TaxID=2364126 RepID=A0ABN9XD76_9DINO|nr:unnamed protein product [Polarella glacialis]